MLTMVLLSADSVFAGAALRFFGMSRTLLAPACLAMGLADCAALSLGQALHNVSALNMSAPEKRILLAVCAGAAIIVGKVSTRYPVIAISSFAVLFSIDNLLAGAQMSSIPSFAILSVLTLILSGLGCLAGFHSAHMLTVRIRPRSHFAIASAIVAAAFLVF